MKYFILALILLSGCVNYDLQLSGYGGSISHGDGTLGARVGSYLAPGEDPVHAGFFVDGAVLALDKGVDAQTLSPLLAFRVQPLEFLRFHFLSGPALYAYQQGGDSDTGLGADFRLGAEYRLGDVHKIRGFSGLPLWLGLEFRVLNAPVDYSDGTVEVSGGYHKKSKMRTVDGSWDWYFSTVFCVGVNF